jgi:RNA polymerase-binding transcription factor
MATTRKKVAPSKGKISSPAKRSPVAKKPKAAERKPASPAAKSTAAAKVAVKGAAVRPAAKDAPKPKPKLKGKPATPPPPVRPLGVLPPESRQRGPERHAPPPVAVKPAPPARKTAQRVEPATGQPLTAKDLQHFEELLIEELKRIRKEMGHLETTVLKVNPRDSSGDLSGYSFHMADAGTDAMEREKAFMFASVEGRKEGEIRAALQRILDGSFGTCENCGQPIARARLEAVPSVRLCVTCKQKEEQASRSQPG